MRIHRHALAHTFGLASFFTLAIVCRHFCVTCSSVDWCCCCCCHCRCLAISKYWGNYKIKTKLTVNDDRVAGHLGVAKGLLALVVVVLVQLRDCNGEGLLFPLCWCSFTQTHVRTRVEEEVVVLVIHWRGREALLEWSERWLQVFSISSSGDDQIRWSLLSVHHHQ